MTRARCVASCPLAEGRRESPWLAEVVRAARVVRSLKGGMSLAAHLGRELHVWDGRALETLVLTQEAVEASDARVRERKREQAEAERKARGG